MALRTTWDRWFLRGLLVAMTVQIGFAVVAAQRTHDEEVTTAARVSAAVERVERDVADLARQELPRRVAVLEYQANESIWLARTVALGVFGLVGREIASWRRGQRVSDGPEP